MNEREILEVDVKEEVKKEIEEEKREMEEEKREMEEVKRELLEKKAGEAIMDFCIGFAKDMIFYGANLERVSSTLEMITRTYGLTEVSTLLQSNFVSLGAYLPTGEYAYRQASIPTMEVNLGKVRNLNDLSLRIVQDHPKEEELSGLLQEAVSLKGYPGWLVNLAQVGALCSVAMMFGGGVQEVICIALIVLCMQQAMRFLSKPGFDQVVFNAILMFGGSVLTWVLDSDYGVDIPTILITMCIMLIPGIALVNAARNLLCGNERNGVLQILKAVIETLSMAFGIFMAISLLDIDLSTWEVVVNGSAGPLFLIVLSFAVSFFNGICFQIAPRDLILAGLGGALLRVGMILLTPIIPNLMVQSAFIAIIPSLYAEFLAGLRHHPSTYFVYPSILPMIPGGQFYYAMVGLFGGNIALFHINGMACALVLIGMSIGFSISSVVAHYVRRMNSLHFDPDRPLQNYAFLKKDVNP